MNLWVFLQAFTLMSPKLAPLKEGCRENKLQWQKLADDYKAQVWQKLYILLILLLLLNILLQASMNTGFHSKWSLSNQRVWAIWCGEIIYQLLGRIQIPPYLFVSYDLVKLYFWIDELSEDVRTGSLIRLLFLLSNNVLQFSI